MKFNNMLFRLISKSLLISTVFSSFNLNCVSAMEGLQEESEESFKEYDEIESILKQEIMNILSNKCKMLTYFTKKLEEKYANGNVSFTTTYIARLKNNIIDLSTSLFSIYYEYKYPTNYQDTIRQLLEYVQKNEKYKNYYTKYLNEIENQNYMRKMLIDIYSDHEDLIDEFNKSCELIRNSVNILRKYNTNVSLILPIFDVIRHNLLSSKSYLFSSI